MKKLAKRFGAAALAVSMVLSMALTVSAVSYNRLTITITDNKVGRTVSLSKNRLSSNGSENLNTTIAEIIGVETMGDGVANSKKSAHIAHGGGLYSPSCSVSRCGLYTIWTTELDVAFQQIKEDESLNAWITANEAGELGSVTDNDLFNVLKNDASKVENLDIDVLYTMYSADQYNGESRYVVTILREEYSTGGGGGGSSSGSGGSSEPTTTTVTGNSGDTQVVIPGDATEPVKLPDPVKGKDNLVVDVPDGGAEIEIPVENPSSGNVVVIIHPDGTEEVVKNTTLSENGVVVELDKDAKVKVVDKSKNFIDMPGHWAENAVDYVAARGLFAGTGVGDTFSPEMFMTRGMLAQVIYNLEGAEKHNYVHGFTDIPAGQWYTAAVNWAAREDVVAGYGDGSYKPNKILSREEFAQILYNYAKALGYDVNKTADLSTFADGDGVSWWATAAMQWAVSTGLMSGKGGNILDATANATRAEGAQLFKNFMENILK